MKKEKDEKNASRNEEYRFRRFDCYADFGVLTKGCGQSANRPEHRVSGPHYDQGKEAAQQKNGTEQAPGQKETSPTLRHRPEYVSIDHGIVDARDYFKHGQTKYSYDNYGKVQPTSAPL
jgi:hypothetical protein